MIPNPLPLSVRLAFGMPSFAGAAMAIPLAIHLTIFYSDVVLVPLYAPNIEQSETVKLAIRSMLGLALAACALLAFGIACFYPISESVHRRIWEGIERHLALGAA